MLTEKFNLPESVDFECDRLSEYIASLFVSFFDKKIKQGKLNPNLLIRFNHYYNLAKKYEGNGKYFRKFESNLKSNWGNSTLMITSNSKLLPTTYITISNYKIQAVDGYIVTGESSKLFVMVSMEKFVNDFENSIKSLNEVIKHEVRHYLQTVDSTKMVGLPKKSVRDKSFDVYGDNPKGDSTPHINKDIEFKPNIYTFVHYIENHLNQHYSKNNWLTGFKKLLSNNDKFKKSQEIKTILQWFDDIKNINKEKYKQYIKEIYKIIFNK